MSIRSSNHSTVPMEQVVLDRDAPPLGGSRKAGNVFKATWNNTIVAVKLLSKETPVDVSLRVFPSCNYHPYFVAGMACPG